MSLQSVSNPAAATEAAERPVVAPEETSAATTAAGLAAVPSSITPKAPTGNIWTSNVPTWLGGIATKEATEVDAAPVEGEEGAGEAAAGVPAEGTEAKKAPEEGLFMTISMAIPRAAFWAVSTAWNLTKSIFNGLLYVATLGHYGSTKEAVANEEEVAPAAPQAPADAGDADADVSDSASEVSEEAPE
ncbi:MAG: hypothetical protein KR126chlam1_00743 [Chlamydiae bacterium]|nr:hypothetical protein [Chlamydiota bacterium]